MKEVKFRAREVTRNGVFVRPGKWVYGDYFSQYTRATGAKHYVIEHPYGRDAGREAMWGIDPSTLGESTNLKASGQELYDGDFFRIKHRDDPEYFDKYLFECYWNYTKWNVRIVQGPDGGYDSEYTDNWLPNTDGYDDSHVIVGNIHDNPEMKGGE